LVTTPQRELVTDEAVLRELSLPANATTRICYFSLPGPLVSFYREVVFPIVDKASLVAASGDEVLPGTGNPLAIRDSLLARARIVICDLSTNEPRIWGDLRAATERGQQLVSSTEGHPATASKRRPRIAIVLEANQTIDDRVVSAEHTFRRPSIPYVLEDDQDPTRPFDYSWLDELAGWLDEIMVVESIELDNEAKRLLDQGMYRAAVIAASSAVEVALKDTVGKLSEPQSDRLDRPRLSSMARFLQLAWRSGLISEAEFAELRELQRVRNQLVHTSESIDGRRARGLVIRAIEIASRLKGYR